MCICLGFPDMRLAIAAVLNYSIVEWFCVGLVPVWGA